jgi:membrane protein implicated in regulation of membrane protease activity
VVLRDLAPVGVVRVNSEDWSAKLAADAPTPAVVGTPIRVVGTTGLTLEVVPAETDGEADGAEPGAEVNR